MQHTSLHGGSPARIGCRMQHTRRASPPSSRLHLQLNDDPFAEFFGQGQDASTRAAGGKTADAKVAAGKTGAAKTGAGKMGTGKTGTGKTGTGKTGTGKTGTGKTGTGKTGTGKVKGEVQAMP